ncbi:hypothetical protein LR48_Vigan07g204400 [Vigna angularis]|uniref:Uncharacterized protein n=1 Tax=Phaseolus angularis TaxID=3914 RepID=A0A0L9UZP4_PHAAN|nr:hypothetical protein LR48_Vigan07g204400 [Vigna angularis]
MRELIEICQTLIFSEEDAFGNDEEGDGGGHEAPVGGGDEEGDGGFDEEATSGAAEDPTGAFNEQPGDDEPAHKDEKVSASHHPSVSIEIDDDGDDDEGEVPLAIPLLRSFVGDPTTTVDVNQLYYAVNVRDSGKRLKIFNDFFASCTIDRKGVLDLCLLNKQISHPNQTSMKIWDGEDKYNGKSMPQYTNEELLGIRKKYVWEWILDNENIRRMKMLAKYGML